MNKMAISGKIAVEIDPVDIEQINIDKPRDVKGFPPYVQAMVAALNLDDTKILNRQLAKQGYILEYAEGKKLDNGNIAVIFQIKKRNATNLSLVEKYLA